VIYIGIDPGASGGIAAVNDKGTVYRVDKMPATDAEVLALLEALALAWHPAPWAVLEHAQAFPKMGVSSAFNYGRGWGAMQMALHAAEIPFDIVVPRKWQAALSCLTRGDKNVSKRRAEQLFPGLTITHATADALLIAEYCRRLHRGQSGQETEEGQVEGQVEGQGRALPQVGVRARDAQDRS
jgi:hypothetical protein